MWHYNITWCNITQRDITRRDIKEGSGTRLAALVGWYPHHCTGPYVWGAYPTRSCTTDQQHRLMPLSIARDHTAPDQHSVQTYRYMAVFTIIASNQLWMKISTSSPVFLMTDFYILILYLLAFCGTVQIFWNSTNTSQLNILSWHLLSKDKYIQ